MRERVGLKSPVRENCTPGSVRGASGNRRPYRDVEVQTPGVVIDLPYLWRRSGPWEEQ